MITVIFKQYGKKPTKLIENFEKVWFDFQLEVRELGMECYDHIKKNIKGKLKRPNSTNNLINSITYNDLLGSGQVGFAIGNINVLDEKAKYWRAVNWGSRHLVDNRKHMKKGFFRPGKAKPDRAEFRKGRWYTSGGKMSKYRPLVKMPIPPMYFVESLHYFAREKIGSLIAKYKAILRKL